MQLLLHEIIGYAGGVISSVSFLPQVWKIWETKSAHDLSMVTLILLFSNASLWCAYGIMIDANPLWITNLIVLLMIFTMIFFKIIFRNNIKS